MREWIASAIVKLTDLEEHESGPFVNRMISVGPDSNFHSNTIGLAMSYLSYVGVISYRTIQRNGFRLAIKRSACDEDVRKLLVDEPPLVGSNGMPPSPAASASKSAPKADKKKSKKKKKKRKDKPEAPPVEAPKADKPKKKKKKCCDEPHVVRSKKTGKRRCKNCGAKYKSKKKEE